jgi:DNA-binding beta-propeller fold protein YncE
MAGTQSTRHRRGIGPAVLVLCLSACTSLGTRGDTQGARDSGTGDPADAPPAPDATADAWRDLGSDEGSDPRDPGGAEVPHDAPAADDGEADPDGGGRDGSDPDDGATPDEVDGADPGPGDAPADPAADDGDAGDPGPACDPDAGPCPCTADGGCPEGFFCDGEACAAWLCIPGATTCLQHLRILCDRDGGGYLVLENCDDQDACTTGDGCQAGKCLPRTAVDCEDGDPCTDDRCDHATGACSHDFGDAPCDDGNPCTVDDHCALGLCVPGGARSCTDGNACTDDLCTSLLGCVHLPNAATCPGTPNPCAAGYACGDGACLPQPRDCDDGDPCTLDACDGGECLHQAVAGCACGTDADCDDGNSCTADSCDGGRCARAPVAGPGCCAADADCEDGDPCTKDLCPGGGPQCTHPAVPAPACCVAPAWRTAFDAGLEGFTVDPAEGDVAWRAAAAPGGGGALYFGNASATGYGTGSRVAGDALSPPVDLPAGARATLTFRTWQDVETTPGQDPFRVDVVADGVAHRAWERPDGFAPRAWTSVAVEVSALAGRRVQVRFSFDSRDGAANDGTGVFVDDVAITSPCRPAACTVESDCVSLGWHGTCDGGACSWDRVFRPLDALGGAPGQAVFQGPSDIALSPDGQRIYASDRDAHRVRVLDLQGREVLSFGGPGTAPGFFLLPRGMAATGDRVWVADSGNHRVQALTPRGVPVLVLGSRGSAPGQFQEPKGLALSADGGTLWVADSGNHRVQALTPWGVVRAVAGAYGRNPGQLRSPSCVVPLSGGGVLVCDTQNNRLQVFREDGAFVAVVAPLDGPALFQPYGAAEADDGTLWVADTYNHRLVRLDPTGRVRDRFGDSGTALGQFRWPLGLESRPGGDLWVVDEGNLRLVRMGFAAVP